MHGSTCAGSLSEVLRKHLLHNDHVNVGQEWVLCWLCLMLMKTMVWCMVGSDLFVFYYKHLVYAWHAPCVKLVYVRHGRMHVLWWVFTDNERWNADFLVAWRLFVNPKETLSYSFHTYHVYVCAVASTFNFNVVWSYVPHCVVLRAIRYDFYLLPAVGVAHARNVNAGL